MIVTPIVALAFCIANDNGPSPIVYDVVINDRIVGEAAVVPGYQGLALTGTDARERVVAIHNSQEPDRIDVDGHRFVLHWRQGARLSGGTNATSRGPARSLELRDVAFQSAWVAWEPGICANKKLSLVLTTRAPNVTLTQAEMRRIVHSTRGIDDARPDINALYLHHRRCDLGVEPPRVDPQVADESYDSVDAYFLGLHFDSPPSVIERVCADSRNSFVCSAAKNYGLGSYERRGWTCLGVRLPVAARTGMARARAFDRSVDSGCVEAETQADCVAHFAKEWRPCLRAGTCRVEVRWSHPRGCSVDDEGGWLVVDASLTKK